MQSCSCECHDEAIKAKAAALVDPPPIEPNREHRRIWDQVGTIGMYARTLSEDLAVDAMSGEDALRLLHRLRAATAVLADIDAALTTRSYLALDHGDVRIEGLPSARVQRARDRKNWDSRTAVFDYVSHRVERFAEEREGEFPPVADIVSMALDVAGVTYCRTTALKSVGLDPEAYCDSSPGRISVTFSD